MIVTQQLGQADPIEALAVCAATPATCTRFTSILAALTQLAGSDRRVIELVGQAMQRGPEGGTNQFYAAPISMSVVRFHADADPDFAAATIVDALEKVLRDPVTLRASSGDNGFLKHAVEGLEARFVIRSTQEAPADLRARAVAALRAVAATGLQGGAQRAAEILGEMGESVAAPATSPEATDQQAAAAAAEAAASAPPAGSPTSPLKIVLAVGFGVVAVTGIAILIGANSNPSPALAKARARVGRLRRKAEEALRRKGDRSRDL